MKEITVRESEELVLPTGEIVSLQDAEACARALDDLRDLEDRLREAKATLSAALVAESARQGTRTLHLPSMTVEIRGGQKTLYDAEAIEAGLREAGMPEERIRAIVKEEVSYKVVAVEAKRAASANPVYARIIDSAKEVVETSPVVIVRQSRPPSTQDHRRSRPTRSDGALRA